MADLKDYFKLTKQNGSPIEWGINFFPDGQNQFWMEDVTNIDLACSIVSPAHLDLYIQIMNTVSVDSVRINYLYGARCDKTRADERRVCMVSRLIVEMQSPWHQFSNTILTPHCKVPSPWAVVNAIHPELSNFASRHDLIIYPDESASRRVRSVSNSVTCSKERDQITGNIVKHVIPSIGDAKTVLVADDLCDGGRTFIDIGQQVTESNPDVSLELYVCHGVFSNWALDKILSYYQTIYTTNSYDPTGKLYEGFGNRVKVMDVW